MEGGGGARVSNKRVDILMAKIRSTNLGDERGREIDQRRRKKGRKVDPKKMAERGRG